MSRMGRSSLVGIRSEMSSHMVPVMGSASWHLNCAYRSCRKRTMKVKMKDERDGGRLQVMPTLLRQGKAVSSSGQCCAQGIAAGSN